MPSLSRFPFVVLHSCLKNSHVLVASFLCSGSYGEEVHIIWALDEVYSPPPSTVYA